MNSLKVTAFLIASVFVLLLSSAQAGDKATPREVVQKVREAAAFLGRTGETGLLDFAARDGRWVWKDTYVWVLKCGEMTDAAHPVNPKLVGRNLSGLKDIEGNHFFVEMCEAAKNQNGGWIVYWWPKVGDRNPSRRVAYVLQVPDSPYQVAAGIYDDDTSFDELNELIR